MADFQFVACSDKLRTVPKRGCRFDGAAIYEGCDEKSHPAKDIVHESELFHLKLCNCFFSQLYYLAKIRINHRTAFCFSYFNVCPRLKHDKQ